MSNETTPETTEEVVSLVKDESRLVEAAKNVLAKYKEGHTVTKNEDYRYPGLKELADALDAL